MTSTKEGEVATEVDRALVEKAADVTGSALRGAMGAEGSQPPAYAAELFREIFNAMKEAVKEIPERTKAGF
jgi:hypothetical protein